MNGWPMVPLGEVLTKSDEWVQIQPDQSYQEVTVRLWGKGATLRGNVLGTEIAATSRLRVHAGQFIISRIDARNGASSLIPEDLEGAVVSNDFPVFTPHRERLVPEFLGWLSKTKGFVELCKAASEGTTNRVRLKEDRFLTTAIPLPPLSEQRRVVERIDALAAKIEEAKRLREIAGRGQRALTTSAISKQLDALDFSGKLGDVLLATPRNGWSARCDGLDTGTPILSLGAVTGFWYRADQFKWTSEATDPNAHYWLKPGDLLISRSNTPDLVGHAAVYNGTPAPCIYPDLLMLLRLDHDRYDLRFTHYVLQSSIVRDFIRTHAKGTSPTMKKISQGTVMAIPFPSNCPKDQQVAIANRLDSLRAKLQDVTNKQLAAAKELDALLPAILDRAFRGEL